MLFDIGHGKSSFHFETTQKLFDQGFPPDIISSDLYDYSISGPVFDMPMTVLREHNRLGSLGKGFTADIAVYRLEKGNYTFTDARYKEFKGDTRFAPVMTLTDGEIIFNEV